MLFSDALPAASVARATARRLPPCRRRARPCQPGFLPNPRFVTQVLAAKCALAIRVDALGDSTDATVGLEAREKVRDPSGNELAPGCKLVAARALSRVARPRKAHTAPPRRRAGPACGALAACVPRRALPPPPHRRHHPGRAAHAQVEARLRQLEGRAQAGESGKPRGKPDTPKYDKSRQGAVPALASTPKAFNADGDVAEVPKSKVRAAAPTPPAGRARLKAITFVLLCFAIVELKY